ncbi:helix-turn-helix transcriptional regulator [Blastococcus haudaquaticus]|uniref:Predicted transcriptional regulator, ArsR family n=1 Tax=Blastococcus haudaquaticus TaxID=1938745 RepID=A0A286GTL2_9ACTN|nr:metalloregulator ArsR/SmtB family transcription factor [Blastococcus haudaquaticus]SOD98875.1 Predicted transcriptional regulator, ArsR family [Blastococcus haudaquaticus]
MESVAAHPRSSATADDGRTRDRVGALLLEHGPQTATELATRLGISPAAVRRHLDSLVTAGRLEERLTRDAHRGRGRPARRFHLTDAGRSAFPHAYDDLALTALRYVAASGGPDAVRAVAEQQLSGLEARASSAVESAVRAADGAPVDRAQALAVALTAEGYAATASAISGGGQLCQHHCPVAHVAAEFPQLCEAETAVIGRLVGTHVQRLATIAHGDGICTTHIPGPLQPGSQRAGNRTAPARPVPGERAAPASAPTSTTPTNHRERTPA